MDGWMMDGQLLKIHLYIKISIYIIHIIHIYASIARNVHEIK